MSKAAVINFYAYGTPFANLLLTWLKCGYKAGQDDSIALLPLLSHVSSDISKNLTSNTFISVNEPNFTFLAVHVSPKLINL